MTWGARLRELAERFERELRALLFACRDARVAWPVRLVVLVVALYILSPVDFIPDSIHARLFGDFDDLVVLTFGFYLAIKLVPADVMAECRARAAAEPPRVVRWWIVVPGVVGLQLGMALLRSWWTGQPLFPTGG
jgi:uncharacterized membrane protein YkvA (DUF1232 family)